MNAWLEELNNIAELWDKHANGLVLPKIEWNSRLRTTAGYAKYKEHKVELNPHVFNRISKEEQINTVIHEMAHLISYSKYGRNGDGHGRLWRFTMLQMGQSPSATHDYDCSGLENNKRPPLAIVDCPCGNKISISVTIGKRMLQGRKYSCARCKRPLVQV